MIIMLFLQVAIELALKKATSIPRIPVHVFM